MDREVLITVLVGVLVAAMFTYTMYLVWTSERKS
jgi:hypothetical protein